MNNMQFKTAPHSDMVLSQDRTEADLSDAFNVLQALLSQAENIIATCRIVAEGRQGKRYLNDNGETPSEMGLVAKHVQQSAHEQRTQISKPKIRVSYKRHQYEQVDVDVLQLFRSRTPNLGIGPIMITIKLLSNCGHIVSGPAIMAAIGTQSYSSIKVYVSRIRKAFRQNGIKTEISQLSNGYGLPSDCLQDILAGFQFSESEVSFLSNVFSKGSGTAEAEY